MVKTRSQRRRPVSDSTSIHFETNRRSRGKPQTPTPCSTRRGKRASDGSGPSSAQTTPSPADGMKPGPKGKSRRQPRKRRASPEAFESVVTEEEGMVADEKLATDEQVVSPYFAGSSTQQGKQEAVDEMEECSSDSNWEDVDECATSPVLPDGPIEVVIQEEGTQKRKKQMTLKEMLQKQLDKFNREVHVIKHKVHLLCWIAHALHLNQLCQDDLCRALLLSSSDLAKRPLKSKKDLVDLVDTFRDALHLNQTEQLDESRPVLDYLPWRLPDESVKTTLAFIALLRLHGHDARLVVVLQPVPWKPPAKSKAVNAAEKKDKANKAVSAEEQTAAKATWSREKPSALKRKKNLGDQKPSRTATSRKGRVSALQEEEEADLRSDGVRRPVRKRKRVSYVESPVEEGSAGGESEASNFKLVSEDEDEHYSTDATVPEGQCCYWSEVYMKQEKQWIGGCWPCCGDGLAAVDVNLHLVDRASELESHCPQPLLYALAVNPNGSVRDVTQRYASEFLTRVRKLRIDYVDRVWWESTLKPLLERTSARTRQEDTQLNALLQSLPMPSSLADLKSHPLYCLARHLLKFEAIYPESAVPLGLFRGEPIYARECVVTLHSRPTWLKEARVVRVGEQPYKVVKGRLRWRDRHLGVEHPPDLELFGHWQTEAYVPPAAQDGKVPRNEYGNIELFQPCMLPAGTVHLRLPYLLQVSRRLSIDCVPAVVGFEGHCGGSVPTYDGFVVCQEHEELLHDACREEQQKRAKRASQRREERAISHWRRLVRTLLIRQRLQRQYRPPCPQDSPAPAAQLSWPSNRLEDEL